MRISAGDENSMTSQGVFSLEGKVAIVTGGGTGLGRVICKALATAGANLVVAARKQGPIEQTKAEVKKLGRKAIAISVDVTDSTQVNKMVKRTIDMFGRIDILVNNAGIAKGVDPSFENALDVKPKEIWELSDQEWLYSINTNLSGTFYCCRAVAKQMIGQGSGKVINLASAGGLRAVRGAFPYGAAKAGVVMLSKILAITWAKHNIQVNCIAPGFFLIRDLPLQQHQKIQSFFPLGRCGEPHEIGPLTVYLSSNASDYVTGECFVIDGAASIGYAPTGYIPK
jgi:NAD(P)-dependent dehydrogenase (short-subunit alcohol dehydrogenase family)